MTANHTKKPETSFQAQPFRGFSDDTLMGLLSLILVVSDQGLAIFRPSVPPSGGIDRRGKKTRKALTGLGRLPNLR